MQHAALTLLLAPITALLLGYFVLYPRRKSLVQWPILMSCFAVTAASFYLAFHVFNGEILEVTLYRWMAAGNFVVDFGLRVDGLTAAILVMVSVVGTLIHLYAIEYMDHEPDVDRFFLYFHFFFLAMLGLIVSNNYLQLYLFWEAVGLASFLLIGFWYTEEAPRRAALKAFLTNRVGDLGFLMAVLLMFSTFKSVHFMSVFPQVAGADPVRVTLIAFLLAWAAAAKSAQFPLHIWLPDAMEGPTPVSALMHAATMVTAGIILLARSMPLLQAAPTVLHILTFVGALTALGAALVACVKTDLKRILAYSTVSHLGLMTLALGLGSAAAAVFHLVIHGFFKALLFLCAGSILHGIGKRSATVEEVGGLREDMPFTFGAFTVGALSLAGIPPFAGFFSKDQILDHAFHHGGPLLKAVAFAIAILSAFYIFRMLFLCFFGPTPRQHKREHAHEGGLMMKIPLALLAICAMGAGFGGGLFGWVSGYELEPLSMSTASIGVIGAVIGLAAAWALKEWPYQAPALARILDAEFGWQGFVVAAVVRPAQALARGVAGSFDLGVTDSLFEGLASRTRKLSDTGSRLATGLINDYLWWMLAGSAVLAWAARR